MTQPLQLGQLLIQSGVLTAEKLAEVLERQKVDRRRLGDLLVERNLVEPRRLAQIISYQLSCPWLSLSNVDLPKSLIELVPRELAIKHTLVPVHLREKNGTTNLYVATHDPTDEAALSEISEAAKMLVRPMVAITYEIRQALHRFYGAQVPSLTTAPMEMKAVSPLPGPVASSATSQILTTTQRMAPAKPPPPVPKKPPPPAVAAAPVAAAPVVAAPPPPPPPPADPMPSAPLSTAPNSAGLFSTETMRFPVVLVLNAPDNFMKQCATAARQCGAAVSQGTLTNAADKVKEIRPAAIVVTDDIYSFDRAGLNKLAIESDALLVVWSEDVEASQLQPLLEGAMRRIKPTPRPA